MSVGHINTENIPGVDKLVDSSAGDGAGASAGAGMGTGDTLSSITAMADVYWAPSHESILVEWADKSMCYRWLHAKSHQQYSRRNTWFTIPVIIMSTLTGTANFAQDKFPPEYLNYATMLIGSINIFAGILTTIQQFLKISELNEAHRASSISWGKFYRNIKIELAKAPAERIPVTHMLKSAKEEYDRLMETSPSLSEETITLFNKTFSGGIIKKGRNGTKIELSDAQSSFAQLKKPEICDSLESTASAVYKPLPCEKKEQMRLPDGPDKRTINMNKRVHVIRLFIKTFEIAKKRLPTADEVMSNIEFTISVDIIQRIINELATDVGGVQSTIDDNDNRGAIMFGEEYV